MSRLLFGQPQRALKARICNLWKDGRCNRGSACPLAHNDNELDPRAPQGSGAKCQNRRVCNAWRVGRCYDGANCPLAHGKADVFLELGSDGRRGMSSQRSAPASSKRSRSRSLSIPSPPRKTRQTVGARTRKSRSRELSRSVSIPSPSPSSSSSSPSSRRGDYRRRGPAPNFVGKNRRFIEDIDKADLPEVIAAKQQANESLSFISNIEPREKRAQEFRRLQRKWHPDKNQGNIEVATAVFQFLQKAKGSLDLD